MKRRVLPGFGLTLGFTMAYLAIIVLLPLSAVIWKSSTLSPGDFWQIATAPRALASYKVTFGLSLIAALVNGVFGVIVAWVLVRYEFPGKRVIDAMVDLPFALPTAVAGIALANLYAENGWVGRWLYEWLGVRVAYTPLGIMVALTFIGLPFVVRTVQPVLEQAERELEEAAASLGATWWQTVRKVVFPVILPSVLAGVSMAFARAIGEYGSVIFISNNLPMVSEITPLLIVIKFEQFDYAGATVLAVVMLATSFALLFVINSLQWWAARRSTGGAS